MIGKDTKIILSVWGVLSIGFTYAMMFGGLGVPIFGGILILGIWLFAGAQLDNSSVVVFIGGILWKKQPKKGVQDNLTKVSNPANQF